MTNIADLDTLGDDVKAVGKSWKETWRISRKSWSVETQRKF